MSVTNKDFLDLDQQLRTLEQRRGAVSNEIETLQQSIERKRTAYRTALALAEIGKGPKPSRGELDAAEKELTKSEDVFAALEQAIRDLLPEWRSAKVVHLRNEVERKRDEIRVLEERSKNFKDQIEQLRMEQGRLAGPINVLAGEIAGLEGDILKLLREQNLDRSR